MERKKKCPRMLLPIIMYFTAELKDLLLLSKFTCSYKRQHRPIQRWKERNYPYCKGKEMRNRDCDEAAQMMWGIHGRAGAQCRVPLQKHLIWKIFLPLINNNVSNKILCTFKFNNSPFRKSSVLLGTTSNLGWLRSVRNWGCSSFPESSP